MYKFLKIVISVGLSIDGTQYTHDFYRHDKNGATTFDRIKKAAELMSEYSIKYNILTVKMIRWHRIY